MKKLFIFADVHGFYTELKTALDEAGFDINNENHIVVSLGDICDRGKESREVLNFINRLPQTRKICIIGNHELLMEEMISRGYPDSYDYSNGTMDTVEQLTMITGHPKSAILDMGVNESWNKYKSSWRWYFELDNYIFVHGWIPCDTSIVGLHYNKNWRDYSVREWESATWINGMNAWNEGVREPNKTIFCGHWHTSWGHANLHDWGVEFLKPVETMHYDEKIGRMVPFADYSPFIDDGIVAIDACTVVSKKINVYTLEIEDEEWERWNSC